MGLSDLDWQFINGYRDGRAWGRSMKQGASAAYKHSFRIGRAEITGSKLESASVLRRRVHMIESAA